MLKPQDYKLSQKGASIENTKVLRLSLFQNDT